MVPNRKQNTATKRQANRILALERQILSKKRPSKKRNTRPVSSKRPSAKLHPVALHAFTGLTSPDTPGLKLHWPDHQSRPSLKYSTRARGNIDVSAGGTQVFFPFPSLSRDQYSYGIVNLGTSDLASTSANFRSGATSYFKGSITNMPFDDAAIADGIVGRCLAVHVKIKYVGSHLNRCGQCMFAEVPDKNLLSTNGIADEGAMSGWGSELMNDEYTRYVNLATEGEADFVFHPFLWKNEQASSQDGWVGYNRLGYASMPAYSASSTGSGTSQALLFGNSGNVIATPHGCIQIYNPSSNECTYQYEVTFHYEFSGRLAHSMSTPSPTAPMEDVTKVRNALLHAKMEHARDPHNSYHNISHSCLKEIENAGAEIGRDALRMVGSSAKASLTKKLAEGLAMLAL